MNKHLLFFSLALGFGPALAGVGESQPDPLTELRLPAPAAVVRAHTGTNAVDAAAAFPALRFPPGASLRYLPLTRTLVHTNTAINHERLRRLAGDTEVRQVLIDARVLRIDAGEPKSDVQEVQRLRLITRSGEKGRAQQARLTHSPSVRSQRPMVASLTATPMVLPSGTVQLACAWENRTVDQSGAPTAELVITNTLMLADGDPRALYQRVLAGGVQESVMVVCTLLGADGRPVRDRRGEPAEATTPPVTRVPVDPACLTGSDSEDIDADTLAALGEGLPAEAAPSYDPVLHELRTAATGAELDLVLRRLATRCPPARQIRLQLDVVRVSDPLVDPLDENDEQRVLLRRQVFHSVSGFAVASRSVVHARETQTLDAMLRPTTLPNDDIQVALELEGDVTAGGQQLSTLDVGINVSLREQQPVVVFQREAGQDVFECFILRAERVDALARPIGESPYGFQPEP